MIPVGLGVAMAGCSDASVSAQKSKEQKADGKKAAGVKSGKQASPSDCVRGEPEALLASRSDFRKSSAAEARETVSTETPIKLTIHHFGCSHYALDFEFTWPGARMPAPQT